MGSIVHDHVLDQLAAASTKRLWCSGEWSLAAFEALYDHLAAQADKFTEEPALSKQVLSCIRAASRALVLYAPAGLEISEVINLSRKFDDLLDMLIDGERPTDPRVKPMAVH
jgi:hypothetical protein